METRAQAVPRRVRRSAGDSPLPRGTVSRSTRLRGPGLAASMLGAGFSLNIVQGCQPSNRALAFPGRIFRRTLVKFRPSAVARLRPGFPSGGPAGHTRAWLSSSENFQLLLISSSGEHRKGGRHPGNSSQPTGLGQAGGRGHRAQRKSCRRRIVLWHSARERDQREQPRLFFMHFWAVGSAATVAGGIKAALGRVATR